VRTRVLHAYAARGVHKWGPRNMALALSVRLGGGALPWVQRQRPLAKCALLGDGAQWLAQTAQTSALIARQENGVRWKVHRFKVLALNASQVDGARRRVRRKYLHVMRAPLEHICRSLVGPTTHCAPSALLVVIMPWSVLRLANIARLVPSGTLLA